MLVKPLTSHLFAAQALGLWAGGRAFVAAPLAAFDQFPEI